MNEAMNAANWVTSEQSKGNHVPTPLEALRQIIEAGCPTGEVDQCWYCGVYGTSDTNWKLPHTPICPWLMLPKIVEALEAAQAFVESSLDPRQWGHMVNPGDPERRQNAVRALFDAMKPRAALSGGEAG